jgi:uncharacterized protein
MPTYEDLEFEDAGDFVRVRFLRSYYFDIPKADLLSIGQYEARGKTIEFAGVSEKKAANAWNRLMQDGFNRLTNAVTGRRTIYIHQNTGIPLIGCSYFGLIDRNTNLIEVRPLTGCNLNCIYCSVDEGPKSRKVVDYVIEEEYLVREFEQLAKWKECDDIEAHINPQGEPLLYAPLALLVKDLATIKGVVRISINTNGVLLTKGLIDELMNAGLTNLNISINTLDATKAKEMSGCVYPVKHVLEMASYAQKNGISVTFAPLLIPEINAGLDDLISYAAKNSIRLGIQNFLSYPHGRNPVKALDMDTFYSLLKGWEETHKVKLRCSAEDFSIHTTKLLAVPLRKGERIRIEPCCPGRLAGEILGVAKGRIVAVRDYSRPLVSIVRTKHNIILAK